MLRDGELQLIVRVVTNHHVSPNVVSKRVELPTQVIKAIVEFTPVVVIDGVTVDSREYEIVETTHAAIRTEQMLHAGEVSIFDATERFLHPFGPV